MNQSDESGLSALGLNQGSSLNVLSLARELIKRPSVTPDGGQVLNYLQYLLERMGFACHRLIFSDPNSPDVDNLYARFGTSPPLFCFAGHVDTVPAGHESLWTFPPFAGTVHEGRLYGRGAADMKGGIAAFISAVSSFLSGKSGSIPGSIGLLLTSDEEGPAINGTAKLLQWMAERGEKIDHCLVGEPACLDVTGETISIGRRGSLSSTLTVQGRQGHVAHPALASNPIPDLLRFLSSLSNTPLDEGSESFQPSNVEITSVDVGNPVRNVIPGTAIAHFNIRFNNNWTSTTLKRRLRALFDTAAREKGQAVRYTLDFQPADDAFLTKPGYLTDLISSSVERVTGRRPKLSTAGGTSDARFIRAYCPVVECGLAGSSLHQIDEHVNVADLSLLVEIYRNILEAYFGSESLLPSRE